MRDAKDELRLIAFHLPDKRDATRGGIGIGGRIRQVRSTSYSFARPVYTATISEGPIGIRTGPFDNHRLLVGTGLLKVIRWEHRPVSVLIASRIEARPLGLDEGAREAPRGKAVRWRRTAARD